MNQLKITHQQSHNISGADSRFEQSLPYEQGSEGGLVQFSLICTNLPIGTKVGFNSDKPGPNPPIYLPPTAVTVFPAFVIGTQSNVPANYSCIIAYYADFNQSPPPDARIEFQAAYVAH